MDSQRSSEKLSRQARAILDALSEEAYVFSGHELVWDNESAQASAVRRSTEQQRQLMAILHSSAEGTTGSARHTRLVRIDPGNTFTLTSVSLPDSHLSLSLLADISAVDAVHRELERVGRDRSRAQQELAELKEAGQVSAEPVAVSPVMVKVFHLARRVASVDSTVLIQGESGVGKDVIARYIHRHGERQGGPFVKLNCGAIPETLIEAQLFGYEPGAFTGAHRTGRRGVFDQANGGTLFLDEIGELPLQSQVKLLEVVQDRTFRRVGGEQSVRVNVRLIAATNRDLARMVREGRFREDLFYRLQVVPVVVPALRERREDLPILIEQCCQKFGNRYRRSMSFTAEVLAVARDYRWPGNVRELENLIEGLAVTAPGDLITVADLPSHMLVSFSGSAVRPSGRQALRESLDEAERAMLQRCLEQYRSTREIARAMGINQSTVVRKLHRHGLVER